MNELLQSFEAMINSRYQAIASTVEVEKSNALIRINNQN